MGRLPQSEVARILQDYADKLRGRKAGGGASRVVTAIIAVVIVYAVWSMVTTA